MTLKKLTLLFVHGWSVTNTDTYGDLPEKLCLEAQNYGFEIESKDIVIGRYVSFQDEVRMEDLAIAFGEEINKITALNPSKNHQIACISHSTGGPIVRIWWQRWLNTHHKTANCPIRYFIMLAPANFGSSLIKFGKAQIGHLKSVIEGSEPGTNILNWLKLGSSASWSLNKEWICSNGRQISPQGLFPFVLSGQSIDRSQYDPLNPYTAEMGSDGVIRLCSANLNARYIRLEQHVSFDEQGNLQSSELELIQTKDAPLTPFKILANTSHSGETKGIMRSVAIGHQSVEQQNFISAVFACLQVENTQQYRQLYKAFEKQNQQVLDLEKLEVVSYQNGLSKVYIHDSYTQIIFRVRDDQGYPVEDYDLIFTAGDEDSANLLPHGFCIDSQRNTINREVLTFYVNFDLLKGTEKLQHHEQWVREQIPPTTKLGFKILPRPNHGFVRYLPCLHEASEVIVELAMKPNATVMVDVVLQRVVSGNLFETIALLDGRTPKGHKGSFKSITPSQTIILGPPAHLE